VPSSDAACKDDDVAQRLRQLEEDNIRLKRLVADLSAMLCEK